MPTRPPLVLLHGLTMSARAWDRVVPLLADRHEVVALTALGHRGGAAAEGRPVRIAHLVDAAARELDARGLQRPHLAGNSLGGWMAIELARRGRAASVCALSPAGFWTAGTDEQRHGADRIRRARRSARLSRPVLPLALRVPAVRRWAMRDVARHGERLTATEALGATQDLLACAVTDDLLTTDEQVAPLDPLPCPVTLAWAEHDAILPLGRNGAIARERLPGARFRVLPGVGHVPMVDDPALVARTILASTGAAADPSS